MEERLGFSPKLVIVMLWLWLHKQVAGKMSNQELSAVSEPFRLTGYASPMARVGARRCVVDLDVREREGTFDWLVLSRIFSVRPTG